MSEEDVVSLRDIKHCLLCGNRLLDENTTVECEDVTCHLKLTAEECESQLFAYVKNGSMKFCYACGGEMECMDNVLICGSCTDSIKFDVFSKKELIISASEVKHCVLCASVVETKSNGKMYCSRARCKFRILNLDSQDVTKRLTEYSENGKIKHCYTCGSSASDDGKYNMCTNEDCNSARLPSEVKTGTSDDKNLVVSNDTKLALTTKPTAIPEASDSKMRSSYLARSAGNGNTNAQIETNQTQVVSANATGARTQSTEPTQSSKSLAVRKDDTKSNGADRKESKRKRPSEEKSGDGSKEDTSGTYVL